MKTEIKCNNCPLMEICEETEEFCKVYGTKINVKIDNYGELVISSEDSEKLGNLFQKTKEKGEI